MSAEQGLSDRSRLASIAEALALAILAALTLATRMGWPLSTSFAYDEAQVSRLALEMVRGGGGLARLGMQSSTGLPNMPGAVWLFSLPYALWADPLGATLFVGLANALAVAGLWYMARRAWGRGPALVVAALYAGAPFAVVFSRKVWAQNLLAPLAVAWAWCAVGAARGHRWALAAHIALVGFAPQVHYAGAALLPGTLWYLWGSGLWRRWRPILIGAGAAALVAAPGLREMWRLRGGLLAQLAGGAESWRASADIVARLVQMGLGRDWELLVLGGAWSWPRAQSWGLAAASIIVGLVLALGLASLLRRRADRSPEASALAWLLPGWLLGTVLAFVLHRTPVYHHYGLQSLPAVYLLAGPALDWARRLLPRWWRPLAALALAAGLVQGGAALAGIVVAARGEVPGAGTDALGWSRGLAARLRDGRPVVVYAPGDSPVYDSEAAVWHVLLWDYPHRIIDGRSVLLLPRSGEVPPRILATTPNLPAWREIEALGLGWPVWRYPRGWAEEYLVLEAGEAAAWPEFTPAEPLTLRSGARLRGWRAVGVDGAEVPLLRFYTWWEIVHPPPAERLHQFHHVLEGDSGGRISGHDLAVSSEAWREGDWLVVWADLELPAGPGPYWVAVGMYTWPDLVHSTIVERPDDPLSAIRLGPVALDR